MNHLVYDWLEKCLPCFIPVLLLLSRYHSFGKDYKKPIYDIIADPQFCVTPMLLAFGTVLNLFKKHGTFSSEMEVISVFCLMLSLLSLCWNILIYWDLTFDFVQKGEDDIPMKRKRNVSRQTGNAEIATVSDKKKRMRIIIVLWAVILILSFVADVVL